MTTTDFNLDTLLHFASATALLAGEQLKLHQQDWRQIVAEQDRDVKVKADRLSEELILSQLQTMTPFPVLTEEAGWHEGSNAEYIWVIDPLDGSFNYQQGIPFCCVAISLVKGNEPLLGVIYDFNHNELFSANIAQGAWLNDRPIRVSQCKELRSSVLNTGFPARQDFSVTVMQQFTHNLQRWRKVRMLGSAALALAYVAVGRAEAYQEQGTLFWDVAAGCALVKAAGGQYQIEGDRFKSPLKVVATNGLVDLS
ncbi:MAG: inositol monophosphatase family protein [Gammaproteobacteria bacterium]